MPPKKDPAKKKERRWKGVYKHLGMYRARAFLPDAMKDLYLGHYSFVEKAAAAYDKAIIHLRGPVGARFQTNEPIEIYELVIDQLLNMTTKDLIHEFQFACERWLPPNSVDEVAYKKKMTDGGKGSPRKPATTKPSNTKK